MEVKTITDITNCLANGDSGDITKVVNTEIIKFSQPFAKQVSMNGTAGVLKQQNEKLIKQREEAVIVRQGLLNSLNDEAAKHNANVKIKINRLLAGLGLELPYGAGDNQSMYSSLL
jgi:hypothetical protein